MGNYLSGDSNNHYFGHSIALSANGHVLAAGTKRPYPSSSYVRVFETCMNVSPVLICLSSASYFSSLIVSFPILFDISLHFYNNASSYYYLPATSCSQQYQIKQRMLLIHQVLHHHQYRLPYQALYHQ